MTIIRYGTPERGTLPFAKAVEADGWLYVSGQVPKDGEGQIVSGNMTIQARVTLDNLKNVLEMAGHGLEDVGRGGVWVDDPRDFDEFNKVYKEYFTTKYAPARVTVQAQLMSALRVEVDCIAYKKTQRGQMRNV